MMTCGCRFDEDFADPDDDEDDDDDLDDDDWSNRGDTIEPLGVDGNGLLTERMMMGDQEVIIHRDDVPESDIAVVRGIRCTTALRTVIDCAPDLTKLELLQMLQECLERGLFTVEEAWKRIREPDMVGRRGADMLRGVLPPHAA
jgi:hypothetical protein